MNRSPASSIAVRFVFESIPASATTTMSATWLRSWKAVTTGMMVWVSGWLPSKQAISNGKPVRSTNSPTTICGSTLRSLLKPTLRRSSSFSASKYSVVTSYINKLTSPPAPDHTCSKQAVWTSGR